MKPMLRQSVPPRKSIEGQSIPQTTPFTLTNPLINPHNASDHSTTRPSQTLVPPAPDTRNTRSRNIKTPLLSPRTLNLSLSPFSRQEDQAAEPWPGLTLLPAHLPLLLPLLLHTNPTNRRQHLRVSIRTYRHRRQHLLSLQLDYTDKTASLFLLFLYTHIFRPPARRPSATTTGKAVRKRLLSFVLSRATINTYYCCLAALSHTRTGTSISVPKQEKGVGGRPLTHSANDSDESL
jgi:hypothetical protein